MTADVVKRTIGNISFVAGLDAKTRDHVITLLANLGPAEKLSKGSTLFRAGETATDDGVVILQGELSVLKMNAPEVIAVAPELMGEMQQFNPRKERTATVVANTDLLAIRFKWASFKAAANQTLKPDENAALMQALQDYAWQHFTQ